MKKGIQTTSVVLILCAGVLWLASADMRLKSELRETQRKLQFASRLASARAPFTAPFAGRNPKSGTFSSFLPLESNAKGAEDPAAVIRRLRNDPAWRARRFNIAVMQVEAKYGRFFGTLVGWSPERIEALKRQIAAGDVDLEQAALPQSLPVSDEEQKAINAAMAATIAENAEQLKNTLGDADYARFDAGDKAEQYRDSVDSIANAMRSKNVQVSGDLEESILGAYSSAVQEASAQVQPVDIQALSESERLTVRQKQQSALQKALLVKMSAVLDEEQLSVFLESELEQSGGG